MASYHKALGLNPSCGCSEMLELCLIDISALKLPHHALEEYDDNQVDLRDNTKEIQMYDQDDEMEDQNV